METYILRFSSTREALEVLLGGYKLSPTDLDEFIQNFDEDQYLDYKNGEITTKQKREKGKATIREYVNAFANSEGGILVVGVADQPREIASCTPSSEPLDSWAVNLLQDMVPRLSPPPRIHVVKHTKGKVLVIAVARAPEFIACVEARQAKYFLRVHQCTFEVPPFLISDLLLGRRQHPVVQISMAVGRLPPHLEERVGNPGLHFLADNIGFVTAEQLELGLITWGVGSHQENLNPHLLAYIDLANTPEIDGLEWRLEHVITKPNAPEITRLTPFGHVGFKVINQCRFPFIEKPVEVLAAIYFLSRGNPPIWFQARFVCERASGMVSRSSPPVIKDFEVARIFEGRPSVQCRQLS